MESFVQLSGFGFNCCPQTLDNCILCFLIFSCVWLQPHLHWGQTDDYRELHWPFSGKVVGLARLKSYSVSWLSPGNWTPEISSQGETTSTSTNISEDMMWLGIWTSGVRPKKLHFHDASYSLLYHTTRQHPLGTMHCNRGNTSEWNNWRKSDFITFLAVFQRK